MVDELVAIALELGDEDRGRRLLARLGAKEALWAFQKECATAYATHLLQERRARPEIRDRLMHRYGFGERTAYRCIDAAIKRFCPNGARADTRTPENVASTTTIRHLKDE
jgi:hypothetical protein